jgi:uncharacterized protein YjbJ (UPF0337 family)
MEDKAKGRMKEAAGAFTGDEEKKAEGRAQQRKGQAGEEAAQRAKTRQTEKEAKRQAEAQGQGAAGRPRRHTLGSVKTVRPHLRGRGQKVGPGSLSCISAPELPGTTFHDAGPTRMY